MKPVRLFLFPLILLPLLSFANPNFAITTGMKIDRQNNLIQPDRYHLSEGIKAYVDGYNQLAYFYFKKSAALGNSMAHRLVGLMYVNGMYVQKDYVKGYAWLKLAAKDNTQRSIELKNQVYKLLTPSQKKIAINEYSKIFDDYGPIASLTRRDRWVHKQKMKMTGTHVGSLVFTPHASGSHGNFDTPHGNGLFNQVQSYVDNYNFGYVTTGEIIPINGEENDEK